MMLQDQLALSIREALAGAQAAGSLPAFDLSGIGPIPVERPKQEEHGDYATPVAMQLAKHARRPPRQIAEAIVAHLPTGPAGMVAAAEAAGQGFVNLRLGVPRLTLGLMGMRAPDEM